MGLERQTENIQDDSNYSSFFHFSSPIVHPPRYYHIYLCKSDHMVPLLKLLQWLSFFLASMILSWRSNANSLAWCALRGLVPAFFSGFALPYTPSWKPEQTTHCCLTHTKPSHLYESAHTIPHAWNSSSAFTSTSFRRSLYPSHTLPHHPGNDLLNVLLETAYVCVVHCLCSGLSTGSGPK